MYIILPTRLEIRHPAVPHIHLQPARVQSRPATRLGPHLPRLRLLVWPTQLSSASFLFNTFRPPVALFIQLYPFLLPYVTSTNIPCCSAWNNNLEQLLPPTEPVTAVTLSKATSTDSIQDGNSEGIKHSFFYVYTSTTRRLARNPFLVPKSTTRSPSEVVLFRSRTRTDGLDNGLG